MSDQAPEPEHVIERRARRRDWARFSMRYIFVVGTIAFAIGLSSDEMADRVLKLVAVLALTFTPATAMVLWYMGIGAYENGIVMKNGGK